MTKKRKLFVGLAAAGLAALIGEATLHYFPKTQTLKNDILPFACLLDKYDVPTARESAELSPVPKPASQNVRDTVEERVAELLITHRSDLGDYLPGGVLLSTADTRQGHLFGRYTSYDPEKTQDTVEDIVVKAAKAQQRVLIFDEGEGGYVMRTGTLPAATDIGKYCVDGVVEGTMVGRVHGSPRKAERRAEIRRLFSAYAAELQERGIDAVLSPVLDVTDEKCETNVIARHRRQYHETHRITREIAQWYIDAMHAQGVRVVGKHFLGAGLPEEGDVHAEEVVSTRQIRPRMQAGHSYRLLRKQLNGVMLTHIGNPADDNTPYSISARAIDYLTEQRYTERNLRGIDFDGLVVTDDLSMNGLLSYVQRMRLTERQRKLVSGCETPQAKAAVLCLEAGAHVVICTDADTDAIVEGIATAYRNDSGFQRKVNIARRHWDGFAEGHR